MNKNYLFFTAILFCNALSQQKHSEYCSVGDTEDDWAIVENRNVFIEGDTSEVKLRLLTKNFIYEGDTVKFFRMENENIFWDSTAYSDGSWNVMERNNLKREIIFFDSDGLKSTNNYDNKWRILNSVSMDNNGNINSIEEYFWNEKGRLIKTILYGVERKFIYGKSINDTVRVVPTDKYIRHGIYSTYDSTVGQIPEEGDYDYHIFVRAPYSFYRQKFPKQTNKESP